MHPNRDARPRLAAVALAVALAAGLAAGGGCARRPPPGPNDAYRDPRTSAAEWNHFFEDPGRGEIYEKRAHIVELAGVRPGMAVADVGAGTGLFSMMLSDGVGPGGVVYAEEVLGKFGLYIAERAQRAGRHNVVAVIGTDTSVGLPPGSIDLAFLCDVYHHFERPEPMLASIRRALRERGELLLVDFRREPDSPGWVREHVRASRDEVIREIERAGFVTISVDDSLRDSYAVRFRRKG
jgi:SAM-dependent methyltransferase